MQPAKNPFLPAPKTQDSLYYFVRKPNPLSFGGKFSQKYSKSRELERLVLGSRPSNQLSITPSQSDYIINSQRIESGLRRDSRKRKYELIDYYLEKAGPFLINQVTSEAYRYAVAPLVSMAKDIRNSRPRDGVSYQITSTPGYAPGSRLAKAQKQRQRDQKYGTQMLTQESIPRSMELVYARQGGNQKLVVPGEELLYSIVSPGTDFTLYTFQINPGLSDIFPWLANIANCFEYYTVLEMCIDYRPSCSTSTDGTITMAADWDCSDQAPTSKRELTSMKPAVTGSPWSHMCWEPPQKHFSLHNDGKLLVRQGAYQGEANLNDLCNFYVGIQGIDADQMVGDLFIVYTIKFQAYQQPPYPASAKFSGSTNNTNPFGSNGGGTDYNSPIYKVLPSGFTIGATGDYFMMWSVTGATALSGLQVVGTFGAAATEQVETLIAAGTGAQTSARIRVTTVDQDELPTVTLTATGNTGNQSSVVRIVPYRYAMG